MYIYIKISMPILLGHCVSWLGFLLATDTGKSGKDFTLPSLRSGGLYPSYYCTPLLAYLVFRIHALVSVDLHVSFSLHKQLDMHESCTVGMPNLRTSLWQREH